ncbi:lantibiotic dehydratase [Bernardetia sp.]|uniref:lantibiotic dehydratase n=1 Tax=Bernardetia sp. TaxID=1937974 RepID=UPI0025C22247|nr:lantibiotic dehydratase [Bernardetia sp.]
MNYYFLRSPLNPLFTEQEADEQAIFLSSPEFYSVIQEYKKGNVKEEKLEKYQISKTKYDLRSRFRCTPFGAFSGIHAGEMTDTTSSFLHKGVKKYHISLDMSVLSNWVEKLHQISELVELLKLYPNTTLYQQAENFRFIEHYKANNNRRKYAITKVEWDEFLDKIIEFCKGGKQISQIAQMLLAFDITLEETTEFVQELVKEQILVTELDLKVTGTLFEQNLCLQLRELLASYPHLREVDFLKKSEALLLDLSSYYQENKLNNKDLLAFSKRFKELEIPFELTTLFQVDTVLSLEESQLNPRIKTDIAQTVKLLAKAEVFQEQQLLEEFKVAFLQRYEEREVPLMHVLDPENGLGYPLKSQSQNDAAPLLEGMPLRRLKFVNQESKNNKWSSLLRKKFIAALKNEENSIKIEEKDVKSLSAEDNVNKLPLTYSSLVNILAESHDAIDRGEYKIKHVLTSGSSAINLLGRFCHADKNTEKYTLEIAKKEQEITEDKILAEIVHLPESRTGNIIARPKLRDYEIPIGVLPSENSESVYLNDIMVSVTEEKIKLRSKKYNKEILPRMANAHNFSFGEVPVYRFLCDLQAQGTINDLTFNWGELSSEPYLPRVEYKNVILCSAQWKINLKRIGLDKKKSTEEALSILRKYFQDNNIPKQLTFGEGDNILPLFTEKDDNLAVFWQELRKKNEITVEEMLYHSDNLFIKDENGNGYTNEFIVPFENKTKTENLSNVALNKVNEISVQRDFYVGSEWLYFKIYTGVKTAEEILTTIIHPLSEHLIDKEIIQEWFFIRYADPEHHLRVRFKGTGNFYESLISIMYQNLDAYIKNELVWKVQIDTYQREIERYGAKNIANSEYLFFRDSVAISKILSNLKDENLRWKVGMQGVDYLLNDFGLSISQKKTIMEFLSVAFLKEFAIEGSSKIKLLAKKYRDNRKEIETILSNRDTTLYDQIYEERTQTTQPIIAFIKELRKNSELELPLEDLIASYIHMFLNRFFRSNQRKHECMIYYMLHQHYRSCEARQKKKKKTELVLN